MFDLSGKKALVTGASGGLGRAIAEVLHAHGAEVALSGTREDALKEVQDALGDRAHVTPCNLMDMDAAKELAPQAHDAMDGLDIVVNNAGLTRDMLSMAIKDENWEQVLDVNLTASFYIIRAALKTMTRARWGRIVNITSIVGVTGNAGQANYAASKAGMIGMTKSIAQEVAKRNITLNCVAPGFIATAMTDKLNDSQKESIMQIIPAGRMGTPDDISAAVLYLASEEAAYVTGQTLHVNGGMAMI